MTHAMQAPKVPTAVTGISPPRAGVFVAALAVAVVLVLAGGASTASSEATHECVQKNELWFRAADGTKLVGHRFGATRPGARTAVVLAHMSEGDLCSWVPFARRLARGEFFVFPFDLRGHGFSEGLENHAKAAADVAAAVRAVRGLGAQRVVVGGASLGAIAAIVATPRLRPPVQGLVSVSTPAVISGQLDARRAVARVRVPTLYIAAEGDERGGYDFAADARELYDATGTAEKRLEVVSGALHGTFLVDGSPRVRALLERFLRDPAGSVP
jgi:pimeloyl-ACP methyl ester carboxylesterase